MAVIKEWRCMAHGCFDSTEPVCPKGCSTVERVFLTPPGFTSDRTKHSDATFRQVAADFGMTNMRIRPEEPARIPPRNLTPHFGSMPKGGTYDVAKRAAEGGGAHAGALAALAQHNAPAEDNAKILKEAKFKRQVIGKRDPNKNSVNEVIAAAS